MFSMCYHGKVHSHLAARAAETRQRYDVFFLCGDEIPYDDTWDRSGPVNRRDFQVRIHSDLLQRGTPFQILEGPLDQRMATVAEGLDRYDKYGATGNE